MVLRYGTSSWSSKDWVGPFYPKGLPAGDFLAHYSTHFDTVEADVTYYRVPDPKLVRGWEAKVPAGFRMAAKFPGSIVHAGKGSQPDPTRILVEEHVREDTERFLGSMALLGDKLGPLLLQFPYFNRKTFADRGPFLKRLEQYLVHLPRDFRYAVELRNRNWVDDEVLDLLRCHRTALALVDHAYMPHPDEWIDSMDLLTTDFTYSRLIGDRKAIDKLTKTFDEIVVDQTPRLARWAKLLAAVDTSVPESYIYANNHYAGHGPATIRSLAELVEPSA